MDVICGRDASHPERRLAIRMPLPYVDDTAPDRASHHRKITMKSIEHSIPTNEFLRRIDAMPMGARERERAKAHFLAALHFADGLTDGLTALRSLAASLAHGIAHRTTRRSTLRNSPAHR